MNWQMKVIAFVAITAILYLFFALICWEWNPGEWHWLPRSLAACCEMYGASRAITYE